MNPNHDIVPALRLMTEAAAEIEQLRNIAAGRTEGFDRAIRRMRRRYFDTHPADTWLAAAFDELLRFNGTFEEDPQAHARREEAANGTGPGV